MAENHPSDAPQSSTGPTTQFHHFPIACLNSESIGRWNHRLGQSPSDLAGSGIPGSQARGVFHQSPGNLSIQSDCQVSPAECVADPYRPYRKVYGSNTPQVLCIQPALTRTHSSDFSRMLYGEITAHRDSTLASFTYKGTLKSFVFTNVIQQLVKSFLDSMRHIFGWALKTIVCEYKRASNSHP